MNPSIALYAVFLLFIAGAYCLFLYYVYNQGKENRTQAMAKLDSILDKFKGQSESEPAAE